MKGSIGKMMQQAQAMQGKMEEAQKELRHHIVKSDRAERLR